MHQVFAELFGGVGLFLLGMTLMTNGLKDATGETLKKLLTKFTETQFKAMLSGIGLTLLVQSSTATTMATIGFVNADDFNGDFGIVFARIGDGCAKEYLFQIFLF
jgi:phosphate:Na+ symporter